MPDFIILGAMKAGTTSLFYWLKDHPEVQLPEAKELNFFSDDRKWKRGLESYAANYAHVAPGKVTGEASPAYLFPSNSTKVAKRIALALPSVRLIALLREPLSRARSHYQHQVRRAREKRTFHECLADLDSEYVQGSCYAAALAPYYAHFDADQILTVPFAELVGRSDETWFEVLSFLGLHEQSRPTQKHNVTANAHQFTAPMRILWELGITQRLERLRIPRSVRKAARAILLRPVKPAPKAVAPRATLDLWQQDGARLIELLDRESLPWTPVEGVR
jgi:hypothetical protein